MPSVNYARSDIDYLLAKLSAKDLKIFRAQHKLTPEMMRTMSKVVTAMTQQPMTEFGGFDVLPDSRDAVYSLPLRFALANAVVAFHWGKKGGLKTVDLKRLQNDITDASYVAYATFYDGIVTRDDKMEEVYVNTCNLLRPLFGIDPGA